MWQIVFFSYATGRDHLRKLCSKIDINDLAANQMFTRYQYTFVRAHIQTRSQPHTHMHLLTHAMHAYIRNKKWLEFTTIHLYISMGFIYSNMHNSRQFICCTIHVTHLKNKIHNSKHGRLATQLSGDKLSPTHKQLRLVFF